MRKLLSSLSIILIMTSNSFATTSPTVKAIKQLKKCISAEGNVHSKSLLESHERFSRKKFNNRVMEFCKPEVYELLKTDITKQRVKYLINSNVSDVIKKHEEAVRERGSLDDIFEELKASLKI